MVASRPEPRKSVLTTAPSDRFLNVPVIASVSSLLTTVKVSPPVGAYPFQDVVVRVTLEPMVTVPATSSWSWLLLAVPGVVPPTSTVKVSSAPNVKLPVTLRMPGDMPGLTFPDNVSCPTVTSGPLALVSPMAEPPMSSSVLAFAGDV